MVWKKIVLPTLKLLKRKTKEATWLLRVKWRRRRWRA